MIIEWRRLAGGADTPFQVAATRTLKRRHRPAADARRPMRNDMQTSMFTERVAGPAIGAGIAGGVASSAAFDAPLGMAVSTGVAAGAVGLIVPFQIVNGWFFGSLRHRLPASARVVAILGFLLITMPLFFGSGGIAMEASVADGLEVLVFLTGLAAFLCGSTAARLAPPPAGGTEAPLPAVLSPASVSAAIATGAVVGVSLALALAAAWSTSALAGLAVGMLALLLPLQIRDGRFTPNVEGLQPVWGLAFLMVFVSAFLGVGALGLDLGVQFSLALLILATGAAAYAAGATTEVLCLAEGESAR